MKADLIPLPLQAIRKALDEGNFDYTSQQSIIIYNLLDEPDFIEIKWRNRKPVKGE